MKTYVLASSTQWPLNAFLKRRPKLPGRWITVTANDDFDCIISSSVRYIFFPHWSSIVPKSITDMYECVGFHMSNLPYGRGGSPLQHLIAGGAKWTTVTAFRMTKDLDAGPIYLKHNMPLEGSAEDCYARAAEVSMEMIEEIVATEPTPVPQTGEATIFKRRRPEDSLIHGLKTIEELYNHIRMLDANGYPRAFLQHHGFRFEFRDAQPANETLIAKVRITRA